ncbi:MAG: DUF559 domain-containing protein [Planctomycetaceae bacterium]|nr:MAG: DUF559 domain-containing protein [Planctomycetaceae bacterium]
MTIPKRTSKRDLEGIDFSRRPRKQAIEFASEVWQLVRGRRILGAKSRSEHPIRPYTLAFVCFELNRV